MPNNATNPQFQVSALASFFQIQLNTWAQNYGGKAVVVSNLKDLWEQASQNSQTPLIYICYAGETAWSSFDIRALTHRVKRNWVVAVKRGRGFTAVRGDTLNKGSQNAMPFYDVVEHIRDMIRAMLGTSEDFGNDYASIKPMSLGQQVIDAYMIEFSTQNDLPPITMTPDQAPADLVTA